MTDKIWNTKYKPYIKELRGKEPKEVKPIVKKQFPNVPSGTPAVGFHNSVKEMFKHKISDQEGLKVLQDLYLIYTRLYSNLNTRKQRISEIRKHVIKTHQSANLYRQSMKDEFFNLDLDERVGIIEAYKEEVQSKNQNKLQLDINDIYTKMRELLLSKNIYDKALALLLIYGGRPIELFFRNKFEYVKDKPSWIKVLNLAKKREGQETTTTRPVLLISPKQFREEVKKLRHHFRNKVVENKAGELAKDKSQTLNKRAIKHFKFLKDIRQKSSLMRKIYADMAWQKAGDKNKENQNGFISSILGHDGLMTSFSYSWVNVVDQKAIKNEDEINAKIDELQHQILLLMNKKVENTGEDLNDENPPRMTSKKTKEEKIKKLEEIYKKNPDITNTQLRKEAKMGSRIINEFLKDKRYTTQETPQEVEPPQKQPPPPQKKNPLPPPLPLRRSSRRTKKSNSLLP